MSEFSWNSGPERALPPRAMLYRAAVDTFEKHHETLDAACRERFGHPLPPEHHTVPFVRRTTNLLQPVYGCDAVLLSHLVLASGYEFGRRQDGYGGFDFLEIGLQLLRNGVPQVLPGDSEQPAGGMETIYWLRTGPEYEPYLIPFLNHFDHMKGADLDGMNVRHLDDVAAASIMDALKEQEPAIDSINSALFMRITQ